MGELKRFDQLASVIKGKELPNEEDQKVKSYEYGDALISRDVAFESKAFGADKAKKTRENVSESAELSSAKSKWGVELRPVIPKGELPRSNSGINNWNNFRERGIKDSTKHRKSRPLSAAIDDSPTYELPSEPLTGLWRSKSTDELDYPTILSVFQRKKNFETKSGSTFFENVAEKSVNSGSPVPLKKRESVSLEDLLKHDQHSISNDVDKQRYFKTPAKKVDNTFLVKDNTLEASSNSAPHALKGNTCDGKKGKSRNYTESNIPSYISSKSTKQTAPKKVDASKTDELICKETYANQFNDSAHTKLVNEYTQNGIQDNIENISENLEPSYAQSKYNKNSVTKKVDALKPNELVLGKTQLNKKKPISLEELLKLDELNLSIDVVPVPESQNVEEKCKTSTPQRDGASNQKLMTIGNVVTSNGHSFNKGTHSPIKSIFQKEKLAYNSHNKDGIDFEGATICSESKEGRKLKLSTDQGTNEKLKGEVTDSNSNVKGQVFKETSCSKDSVTIPSFTPESKQTPQLVADITKNSLSDISNTNNFDTKHNELGQVVLKPTIDKSEIIISDSNPGVISDNVNEKNAQVIRVAEGSIMLLSDNSLNVIKSEKPNKTVKAKVASNKHLIDSNLNGRISKDLDHNRILKKDQSGDFINSKLSDVELEKLNRLDSQNKISEVEIVKNGPNLEKLGDNPINISKARNKLEDTDYVKLKSEQKKVGFDGKQQTNLSKTIIDVQILKSNVIKDETLKSAVTNNEEKTSEIQIQKPKLDVSNLAQTRDNERKQFLSTKLKKDVDTVLIVEQKTLHEPGGDNATPINRKVGKLIIMTGDQRDKQLKDKAKNVTTQIKTLTTAPRTSTTNNHKSSHLEGFSLTFMSNELEDDGIQEDYPIPKIVFNEEVRGLKSIMSKGKKKNKHVFFNPTKLTTVYSYPSGEPTPETDESQKSPGSEIKITSQYNSDFKAFETSYSGDIGSAIQRERQRFSSVRDSSDGGGSSANSEGTINITEGGDHFNSFHSQDDGHALLF